jgi:hypothetical protein
MNNKPFERIPQGKYRGKLSHISKKLVTTAGGTLFVTSYEITMGEYKGRLLFHHRILGPDGEELSSEFV